MVQQSEIRTMEVRLKIRLLRKRTDRCSRHVFNEQPSDSTAPFQSERTVLGGQVAIRIFLEMSPGVQAKSYPPEVQPPITMISTPFVRLGEILIEENPELYSFTDGVDDYSYLAIDTDKSGVAGDSPRRRF